MPIADWHKDKDALLKDHNSKGEMAAAIKKVKAEVWGEDKPEKSPDRSHDDGPSYELVTKEGEHISDVTKEQSDAHALLEGSHGYSLHHKDGEGVTHYKGRMAKPTGAALLIEAGPARCRLTRRAWPAQAREQ